MEEEPGTKDNQDQAHCRTTADQYQGEDRGFLFRLAFLPEASWPFVLFVLILNGPRPIWRRYPSGLSLQTIFPGWLDFFKSVDLLLGRIRFLWRNLEHLVTLVAADLFAAQVFLEVEGGLAVRTGNLEGHGV
jgi:hypothetical protein